ncbi:MAG: hypothetical protein VXW99_01520, partial [Pseudomonadota bacterium]|nr:hypothetical protein [Pseudomonadota bacterium]
FAIEDNNYFAIWHQDIANVGTDNGLTERLRVDSSGNLLVNGSNATGKLVVDGDANAYTARVNSSTTTGQAFGARVRAGTNSSDFAVLVENTSATTMFAVRGDGNCGVGTSAPEETLSVMGDFQVALNTSVTGRGLKVSTSNSSITDDLVTFNAQASTGILAFQTNSSERLRIDASGNLLVGKDVNNTFNEGFVAKAAGGANITSAGDIALELNRRTSDGTLINFRKDNTAVGSIASVGGADIKVVFSSDGDQYITGNSASNYLTFSSANAERMRLDSSGNLLVGTTSASTWTNTAGFAYRPSSSLTVTRSAGEVAHFNRLTSDGTILDLRKDGSTVGTVGTNGGDLFVGTGDTNILFSDGSDALVPANTGGATR